MPKVYDIEKDRELAERIRLGDRNAFAQLYRIYYENLCRFALRFVNSTDLAEEMVQDVFLNVWRKRTEWPKGVNPKSYLFRSVRNRSLDYLKHRKVELKWENEVRSGTPDQHNPSPDSILENNELARAIQEAIDRLPDRRKTIFLLSREHELTYQEIADVLEISVKTVETQMGRSLKMLREILSGH